MGTIEAAGFRARQADNVIIFTGPATLVLNGEKASDTKPNETKPAAKSPAVQAPTPAKTEQSKSGTSR